MSASGDLLDVNTWLACVVESHPHHGLAMKAWDHLIRPAFCRVTQHALLRLLSNAKVMGPDALTPRQAWELYDVMRTQADVRWMEEPPGLETGWRALTLGRPAARDLYTDAYLAAFAQCAQMRLVTFDRNFKRFNGVTCLVLGADV